MSQPEAPWAGGPLGRRGFRLLVLALLLVPLGGQFLLTLALEAGGRGYAPTDFYVYLQAARDLASGADPYRSYFGSHIDDPLLRQGFIYPPLLARLLQPVAGLPLRPVVAAGLAGGLACLVAGLAIVLRGLGVRSLEALVWAALAAVLFFPAWADVVAIQVNLLLFLLGAVWFRGWLGGDRWWGGVALGAGLALKILQAPWALLVLWGRRFRMMAAAAATVIVLWALAGAYDRLAEYWLRVFPSINGASGFRENQTPFGLVMRILDPASFYVGHAGGGMAPVVARIVALAVAAAALLLTWWALGGRPRAERDGRALEAAAAIALTPLLTTVLLPHHLVFLLVPGLVLAREGWLRRDGRLLAAVVAAWVLIGPLHMAMLDAIAAGFANEPALQVWAESGLAGILVLWAASVAALRSYGPARVAVAAAQPAVPAPV